MPDTFSLHDRFRVWITHRYFIRLHMAMMLSLVLLSGVLASRSLHAVGVRWLVVRYPAAVAVSYLVFFLMVRLWVAYAMRARSRRESGSGGDLGDLFPGGSSGGSGGGSGGGSMFSGGGGKFGGGGASATFEEGDAPARMVAVPVSHSGGGGGGSGSGGFDIDGDGLIILIIFLVAVAGILGAGIILVVHAPVILSEAAFQAAMAAGLVKASRGMHEDGWMESVFKQTLFPFLVAFVGAAAFGFVALRYCPGGTTLHEVFRTCVFR